ncbi:MAG: Cell division protein FtsH [Candidatus Jettenia ecosi]|uniref:Cell division protein FtsH n=1 Tax=Candidatus Jettenia ecosi TaxID=2494326 RepID=A0A533QGA6_9BACT|nr:MAG: Cell division protein FtsH [Candidatus Jettenia ecosi]
MENKGRLQVLAKRLLEKEVIEGEELREIISHNLPDPKNNTL